MQVTRTVDVTLEVGEMINTVTVSGDATPYCKRKTRRHSSTLVNGKCGLPLLVAPKVAVARRCHSSSLTAVWYQTIGRPARPLAALARTPPTSALTAARDWARTFLSTALKRDAARIGVLLGSRTRSERVSGIHSLNKQLLSGVWQFFRWRRQLHHQDRQ